MTAQDLWATLAANQIVEGEQPPSAERPAPWPVRVMLGVAGWIGSLFLLGFAGAAFAFLFRSADAAFPAGFLCCVCAYFLFLQFPRNDFAQQAGFAVSLAGQILVATGLDRVVGHRQLGPFFLTFAMVEAVLSAALPNYVHRAFTAIAANVLLFLAAATFGFPGMATALTALAACLIWLAEETVATDPKFWEPIGYGCAIALLPMDGSILMGSLFWKLLGDAPPNPALFWVGPTASGIAVAYTAWTLTNRYRIPAGSPTSLLILAGAVTIGLCGLVAPGVSAALLVATLGFASGRHSLLGLGLLAFLAYLGHFYYQLQVTLLTKSIVLSATGAALLILWQLFRRGGRRA